jgi:hypothetical protein
MTEEELSAFKEWLEDNVRVGDPTLPTYLFMSFESLLPPSTWLVHFSDNAFDISVNGFIYGAPDMFALGLTTHFSDVFRKNMPGWNFAFEEGTRGVRHGGKYGKESVLFQSAGVKVYHFGDEEDQVIFYGPHVERLIYLGLNYDRWCIKNSLTDREIYGSDNINDVTAWAIRNERQYASVIYTGPGVK